MARVAVTPRTGPMTADRETDADIRQIEFELEKAEHGLSMPYDAERVGQLRKMLVDLV